MKPSEKLVETLRTALADRRHIRPDNMAENELLDAISIAKEMAAEAERPLYIVSVMVFRIEEDGKRRANLHLVAARSSSEAEARIKESSFDRAHLAGRAFINTDEHLKEHGTALRFYSTSFKNDDNISDIDFERWVRNSTNRSRSDGDVHAAAFREVKQS